MLSRIFQKLNPQEDAGVPSAMPFVVQRCREGVKVDVQRGFHRMFLSHVHVGVDREPFLHYLLAGAHVTRIPPAVRLLHTCAIVSPCLPPPSASGGVSFTPVYRSNDYERQTTLDYCCCCCCRHTSWFKHIATYFVSRECRN